MSEKNLNISPEVEKELIAFIKEKTGCGSFVLGMMDDTTPCKHFQDTGQCGKLHKFEAFSCGIEDRAIAYFLGVVTGCLEDSLKKEAGLIPSPYESSTT